MNKLMYLSETEVLLLLSDSGSALIIYPSLFLDDVGFFVSILDAGFVIGLKLIFDPLCLGTLRCHSKNTHFLSSSCRGSQPVREVLWWRPLRLSCLSLFISEALSQSSMRDLELPEVIRILMEGPCIATPEIRISPMPLLSFC